MGYSIGQVSLLTRVSRQTLREYGRRKLIPEGTRCPSGHREYSDSDVAEIRAFFEQKR